MNLEQALQEFAQKTITEGMGHCPSRLADSIQYSLLSPGKRLRPRLLLSCGRMLGLSEGAILPAAVAIEMIHCFTLIHDDLPCMDNDMFRRGIPTNHVKFGEPTALMAGDALIPMAFEALLQCDAPADRLYRGLRRLIWASGPRGVLGGQVAEEELTPASSLSDLRMMYRGKTGALFRAALKIPQDLAGILDPCHTGELLDHLAEQLGFAFQVADDLGDAAHSEESTLPKSILFYQSAHSARALALQELDSALIQIEKEWGEAAFDLISLAKDVGNHLKQI